MSKSDPPANTDVVLRMTVTEDRIERGDPPGAERRKTVGFSLATESDDNDDNELVKATSAELMIHGCHKPGWFPFVEGGDYLVTIAKAPPLERKPEAKAEGGDAGGGGSK